MSTIIAHGLRIQSDKSVSVKLHASDAIDGTGLYRILQRKRNDAPLPGKGDWIVQNSGHLDIAQVAGITVLRSYCGSLAWFSQMEDGSRRLFVARAPSISGGRYEHTILHSFLPHALACWGYDMLHAAAIVVGGRAVLLSGVSGSGKSTLAAGFLNRGETVLSDDIVRVQRDGASYVAYPSYAGARLRTGSFLLSNSQRTGRSGRFGLPKHRVMVDAHHAVGSYPVAAIFFMARSRRTHPEMEPLSGGVLLDEWLNASFMRALPKHRFAREAFRAAGALAQQIPAYRLSYKRSPQHFDQLLDGILELARSLPK